jgi:hypothetical protein
VQNRGMEIVHVDRVLSYANAGERDVGAAAVEAM